MIQVLTRTIRHRGAWKPDADPGYPPGDVVTYDGIMYLCTWRRDEFKHIPPPLNPAGWQRYSSATQKPTSDLERATSAMQKAIGETTGYIQHKDNHGHNNPFTAPRGIQVCDAKTKTKPNKLTAPTNGHPCAYPGETLEETIARRRGPDGEVGPASPPPTTMEKYAKYLGESGTICPAGVEGTPGEPGAEEWDPRINYFPGDCTIYRGTLYECIKQIPPYSKALRPPYDPAFAPEYWCKWNSKPKPKPTPIDFITAEDLGCDQCEELLSIFKPLGVAVYTPAGELRDIPIILNELTQAWNAHLGRLFTEGRKITLSAKQRSVARGQNPRNTDGGSPDGCA